MRSKADALRPEVIRELSYNELIGIVRETNRPPGGRESLHEIASRCYLTRASRVLDVGTSTGWTAIELARLVGCKVVGIDINPTSVEEARARARTHGLAQVRMEVADAKALPFADESFDLVICGNVTSLIDDREAAFREYRRVIRPGGYLVAIPMYYLRRPSPSLLQRVRNAIQVQIQVQFRQKAIEFFDSPDLETFSAQEFRFEAVPKSEVRQFCREILSRPHLDQLDAAARRALAAVYTRYMLLFRDNLALMGYTVLILRKTASADDRELFIGRRL